MLILPPHSIGRGWRQLQLGESIRSTDQWFSIMHDMSREYPWRVSSFWTSDKRTHDGKVPYRRAVSLKARFAANRALVTKVFRFVIWPWWNKRFGHRKDQ